MYQPKSRQQTAVGTMVSSGICGAALLVSFDTGAQNADDSVNDVQLEEVVVTGTRIAGAEGAVGTQVSQFGETDFREVAEITVSELFKNAVPSVLVPPTSFADPRNFARNENINIHGLGGERTLVLVNGTRVAMHGWAPEGYDPSIVPSISLERVDLLTAGASATYGSDAVAGVVNLVLRRGFDGAETQLFTSTSGGNRVRRQISQLFGQTWNSGNVTVGFEYYDQDAFRAVDTDHMVYDFTGFGLADNRTPISSATPAIVSTGRPSTPVFGWGVSCQDTPPFPAPFNTNSGANCYSVPAGSGWDFGTQAPGATVDWATLLNNDNVDNLFNPWEFADYTGDNQRTAFTVAFDQRITDSIEAFADLYYSDRSSGLVLQHYIPPTVGGAFTAAIRNPADYPYTPTGAPPGLMVSYSTQAEINGPHQSSDEEASRVAVGLNIDGPGEWSGRVYYGYNQVNTDINMTRIVNTNNVNAALGNVVFDGLGRFAPYVVSNDPNRTVTAGDLAGQSAGIQAAFPVGTAVRVIDPASVPFLNVFCDSRVYQCNDPRTLDFLSSRDHYDSTYEVHQIEATVTRALFDTAGGTTQIALGISTTDERYNITRDVNYTAISTEFPQVHLDQRSRDTWSVFGEMRVPLVSEQNGRAGLRDLELQLSARYDDYSDFGSTTNPQLGINWEPSRGLTFRGNRGRSFRAPTFGNLTGLVGANMAVFGVGAAGRPGNPRFQVCTPQQVAQGLQPTPGSFAEQVINAIGAADCSDDAIMAQFNAVAADPNNSLYPSAVTVNDAQSFLRDVRLPGLLALTGGVGDIVGLSALHPAGFALQPEESDSWSFGFDYAPPFADDRLTFGLTYFEHQLENLITAPGVAFPDFFNTPQTLNQFALRGDPGYSELLDFYLQHPLMPSSANVSGVSGLWDLKVVNIGLQEVTGADFNARYEWGGDRFLWHAGITGTYMIRDELRFGGSSGEDTFESSLPGLEGLPTAPRMRTRARFGLSNNAGLTATLFVNYQSRYYARINAPEFATNYDRRVPSYTTYDLTVSYGTDNQPDRDFLQNLSVRLSLVNLTDQDPPFFYNPASSDVYAIDNAQFSAYGRTLSLSLSKSW